MAWGCFLPAAGLLWEHGLEYLRVTVPGAHYSSSAYIKHCMDTESHLGLCQLWSGVTWGRGMSTWPQQPLPTICWGAWGEAHAEGGEPQKSPRTWWGCWTGAEGLCKPTGWSFHEHLVAVPGTVNHPSLLDVVFFVGPKKAEHKQPQWLLSSVSHSNYHEVLWETGVKSHHLQPSVLIWPAPVRLQEEQVDRGHHSYDTPHQQCNIIESK